VNAAVHGVDIGMPTRGSAPWIGTAVESILAQTFTDWRLVISENGPASAELAESLARYLDDERITLVATGEDLGPAANHTRLVQQGSRPYVALLHDDDYWAPEFLERRVAFLDRHPECGFVFGRYETVDEEGRLLSVSSCSLAEGVHRPETMVPHYWIESPVGMTSLLVRRSAYEAVGGQWESMPWMDLEMWFRIVARMPIGYIDVVDSTWRRHGAQWTARVGTWGETLCRVYAKYEETLRAVPELVVDTAPLRKLQANAAVQASLDSLESGDLVASRSHLRAAIATDRRTRFDRRVGALRLAHLFGGPGARTVVALRHGSWKIHSSRNGTKTSGT
jgi:glycosyltransferase involved in cell wall biosynthesis